MIAIINARLCFPDEIRDGSLLMDNGRIVEAGDIAIPEGTETIDAGGLYAGPGLIDEHLHGYSDNTCGYDIIDNVHMVAKMHLKEGTTSVTPSPSYSLTMDKYLGIISQCNEEIASGESSVVGIHLEGPYVNHRMAAGRKYAWKYSDEAFERLFEAGGKNILHCTYAPEMPWARDVERIIKSHGVVMDIGHTESDPENLRIAVQNGAKIVTHLFDATGHYKGIHAADLTGDPQDSVSQVLLSMPDMYYELICDSMDAHTTGYSQRLALKCAGEDRIILVSDCTFHKRVLENPEDYPHRADDVNLGHDGRLFGSKLTVARCARNFKKNTGVDIRTLFKCASTNSAMALGIDDEVGSILPGRLANIVLTDDDFYIHKVIFHGKVIS
ncbi:MAG: amidohydrolase family protein [Eubacteriales bacterium]|nr:amidohydrolase family protein [Eubacteriales bacterium]